MKAFLYNFKIERHSFKCLSFERELELKEKKERNMREKLFPEYRILNKEIIIQKFLTVPSALPNRNIERKMH
jgi:hypothetical protein